MDLSARRWPLPWQDFHVENPGQTLNLLSANGTVNSSSREGRLKALPFDRLWSGLRGVRPGRYGGTATDTQENRQDVLKENLCQEVRR